MYRELAAKLDLCQPADGWCPIKALIWNDLDLEKCREGITGTDGRLGDVTVNCSEA
jgi:hypothetical protein